MKIGSDVLGKRIYIPPTTFTRKGKRVHRKGYYKTDLGAPGRTPLSRQVIPPLEEGELTKHGFSMSKSTTSRRKALAKSVKEDGYRTTLGRIIALQVFFKRTNPTYSRRMESDRKWLVKKFGGSW
jgi:hypothetical protein